MVVLQGLQMRPELNGRRGTAKEWVAGKQRLGVDVEGVGRLALRLDNLRPEDPDGVDGWAGLQGMGLS